MSSARTSLRCIALSAMAVGLILPSSRLLAAPPEQKAKSDSARPAAVDAAASESATDNLPPLDVLEGLRSGQLAAVAEGDGKGRFTLALTNRTSRKLRVVLPPGLVVANATGQFGGFGGMGGMGGFGGGMGGMGGMGGGMMGGGMGGGMMGGGMGGMGGGMMGGGMGGGMMGGGMGGMGGGMMGGGGTMPATMGMMMLGRLIMNLIGDRDSWDQRSLMSGMMGGMGMMGGGMGGGMMGGGMGGGMMGGGMGGGFRSVPPTGLPEATLKPHQTRHLPTTALSLKGPNNEERPDVPAKAEKYRVGSIDQVTDNARVRSALKRLAEEKAPQTIAQLVLWNVAAGLDWAEVSRLSKDWANDHELALARQFVARIDEAGDKGLTTDSGVLYWELKAKGTEPEAVASRLRRLWGKSSILGLKTEEGVPARPSGPGLACRLEMTESALDVSLLASNADASAWSPAGSFAIKRADLASTKDKDVTTELKAARLGDAFAERALEKLVQVRLAKGPRVNDRLTYKLTIENGSPLILNGLALAGVESPEASAPSAMAGMCLPPHKTFTVPATSELVQRLKLKNGVRALAADLSGL